MKRMLMLAIPLLLVSGTAVADVIGIYSDQTGTSCTLAPGFTTTATIIHMYSAGTSGSFFSVSVANAPGTSLFAVNTPYQPICVYPPCPYYYGGCYQSPIVVGTLTAILGSGFIEVVAAEGQPAVMAFDCAEGAHSATGGRAYIGTTGPCTGELAVENSTWGRVKALYR